MEGFDQAEDPIAALADQIADRLALRLGSQLARLAASLTRLPHASSGAPAVSQPTTASASASSTKRRELGCVRLGGGSCARLRFNPVAMQARWSQIGGALPAERPHRRRSRPPGAAAPSGARRLRSWSLRVAHPVSRYAWSRRQLQQSGTVEGEGGPPRSAVRAGRQEDLVDALFQMVPSVVIGRRSAGMTYQAEGWLIVGDAHAARGMGR